MARRKDVYAIRDTAYGNRGEYLPTRGQRIGTTINYRRRGGLGTQAKDPFRVTRAEERAGDIEDALLFERVEHRERLHHEKRMAIARPLQAGAFLAGVYGVTRLDGMTFQPMGGKASNSALVAVLALGSGLILYRYYPKRKQIGVGLVAASAGLALGMGIKAKRGTAGNA